MTSTEVRAKLVPLLEGLAWTNPGFPVFLFRLDQTASAKRDMSNDQQTHPLRSGAALPGQQPGRRKTLVTISFFLLLAGLGLALAWGYVARVAQRTALEKLERRQRHFENRESMLLRQIGLSEYLEAELLRQSETGELHESPESMDLVWGLVERIEKQLQQEADPENPVIAEAAMARFVGTFYMRHGQPAWAIPFFQRAIWKTGDEECLFMEKMLLETQIAICHQEIGDWEEAARILDGLVSSARGHLGARHPLAGELEEYYLEAESRKTIPDLSRLYEIREARLLRQETSQRVAAGAPLFPGRASDPGSWKGNELRRDLLRVHSLSSNARGSKSTKPETLINLQWRLSEAYRKAGDLRTASEVAADALATARSTLDDPAIVFCCTAQLAFILRESGLLDRSTDLLTTLLESCVRNFGEAHRDTLCIMIELADTHRQAERLDQANALFERAEALLVRQFGPSDPDTLVCRGRWAVCLRKMDRIEDSLALLRKMERPDGVLEERLSRFFPVRDDVLLLHEELGLKAFNEHLKVAEAMIDAQEKPDKVVLVLEKAGKLITSVYEDLPVQYADALGRVAKICMDNASWPLARELLTEVLETRRLHQPESWTTYNAESALGEVLLRMGLVAESEPLLLNGFRQMQLRINQIPTRVRAERMHEAVGRLDQLYSTLNQPEEARLYREMRKRYPINKPE